MRKIRVAALPLAVLAVNAFAPHSAAAENGAQCRKILREIALGQSAGFSIRALDVVRSEPEEGAPCDPENAAEATREISIVAVSPKRQQYPYLLLQLPWGYSDDGAELESARQDGKRFELRLAIHSKYADTGAVDTTIFEWRPERLSFRVVDNFSSSPAREQQKRLWAAVRGGDIPEAEKLISSLDYKPNGRDSIRVLVAERLLEEVRPLLLEAFRKRDTEAVARWITFLGPEFPSACPFGIPSCRGTALFAEPFPHNQYWSGVLSDYGYVFSMNGRRAQAEMLYRRLLSLDPSHTMAHLSLAELLWLRGARQEAAFHYRVYLRRMESQGLWARVGLVVRERALLPSRGAAFSRTEELRAAGLESVAQGGSSPSYSSLRYVPAVNFLRLRHREGFLSEYYLVKREFALEGIPLRKGSRFEVDEELRLANGIAGERIIRDGLPIRSGEQVSLHKGRLVMATLDGDVDRDGFKLQAGSVVTFEEGRLSSFWLREKQAIGPFTAERGQYVKLFTGNGGYSGLTLGEPVVFRGVELPRGAKLFFDLSKNKQKIFPDERNAQVESPTEVQMPDGRRFRQFVLNREGDWVVAKPLRAEALPAGECGAGRSLRKEAESKRLSCGDFRAFWLE
jgi:tetratricopeptide (TPR) repeat protein